MTISKLIGTVGLWGLGLCATAQIGTSVNRAPNVVVILADDLGYGDLSCYGHPTIRTPHLDQMAAEGMRFTQFYVGANVCTPSRAALLTGRLPIRYGLTGGTGVFFPNSAGGLPTSETTLAAALKGAGYQSAIIGKWHLGHLPQFMPLNHGFDYYFGVPYSNDMIPQVNKRNPPLPLYRNNEIIETAPNQDELTKRYTDEAVAFIERNKNKPFFLYYASNFPHVPLHASAKFKGKSERGLYGDVVAELDWSVGQILEALKVAGIDENTLVIFTSDNGPWLLKKKEGGSAGLLFEGKGSAYEGGMRVPMLAWWPGTIKANTINTALATTMDIFPTVAKLTDTKLPKGRVYDGVDMLPLLQGAADGNRDVVIYYHRSEVYAIRKGPWKAHFTTKPSYSREPAKTHPVPLLYNLLEDPSEKYNVNEQYPDIVADLNEELEKHRATVVQVPSQLEAKIDK